MTSQIDITKPIAGAPTTASVRANFSTAAQEITALQNNTTGAPFLSLQGGVMQGAISLANDPSAPMHPVTLGYFQANGGGGGSGGIAEAPIDGTLYARQDSTWLHAVNTAEMTAAITAATFPDAPQDGVTYGRLNHAWAPAVTTAQMNAAITAAAYPDAPNNGNPYLRVSGAWRFGVQQTTPDWTTAPISINQSTTGADKAPVLSGPAVPISPGSDAIKIQARRLTTPAAAGQNNDGACIVVAGLTLPSLANGVQIYTGTNAAGYKLFAFNADGTFVLRDGSIGLQGAKASISYPFDNSHGFGFGWNNTAINLYIDGNRHSYLIYSPNIANYVPVYQIAATATNLQVWWEAGGWGMCLFDQCARRFKENLEPSTVDALGIINAVPVWSADVSMPFAPAPTHWDCVVIADEVEPLIPSAYMPAPPDEPAGYETLNPMALVCTLIKAVQQLTARVTALEPSGA